MAKKSKKTKKPSASSKLTAATADRHLLYQSSVQNPEFEVELAESFFEQRVGRPARTLREDFCGTALLCSHWVKSHPDRRAIGVDLDPAVLAWGRAHNIEPLGDDAERVTLLEQDVREPHSSKSDVLMALNYSYFCFQDRATLRGYFESVLEHLEDDGLFFLDLFGGWEAQQVLREPRKQKGFRYIWHQAEYDPISAHFLGHIHFRFKDGTRMDEAFTYDWRLWTIPELRELLAEAGYGHVEVLWEEEDEEGEGTGTFSPVETAGNDPGFNAYLLASRTTPPIFAEDARRAEEA